MGEHADELLAAMAEHWDEHATAEEEAMATRSGRGSRFVEVPLAALEAALLKAGFRRAARRGEVTYEREVPMGALHEIQSWHPPRGARKVVVYTSVAEQARQARACGEDAIRVAVVWEDPQAGLRLGIGPGVKVLRTGTVDGVVGRMLGRMREAYAYARAMHPCDRCGAPVYEDSGRCVVRECREGGWR